ncbi:MAG: hypothetical protein ACOC97_04225 [Myxococcota bacterium]
MAWACALMATLAMGCLVTEDGSFTVEENFPAVIESQAGAAYPLGRVHVLDLDEAGATVGDLPLEVVITDFNVEQGLQAVVLVDDLDTPGGTADPIAATGELQRELTVTISNPQTLMDVGCHRVEMQVSSRFRFSFPPEPVDPDDLGSAVWWFFTRTDPAQQFDPASCPAGQQ